MAYTALEAEKRRNAERYNRSDIGPSSPREITIKESGADLITSVLHFVNERCVDLRFDDKKASEETKESFLGKSASEKQIPYNMQMDIDRLSFSKAMERFYFSGATSDAFDVYFCFLEMFGGGYANSRRMIELLSEYESTASTLLMSHRDHYSHSVYVFLLGLALYDSNSKVRNTYRECYGIDDDTKAAHHYLEFWGWSSLFHDIGYPFEISFEQMKSYFSQRNKENGKEDGGEEIPFVCFGNMDKYLKIDQEIKSELGRIYPGKDFNSIEEWLAFDIRDTLKNSGCAAVENISEKDILEILHHKARPTEKKKFMDHAYFSAIILFKELFEELGKGDNKKLKKEHMDALTAIALHNSLYKREITGDKNVEKEDHAFGLNWHPLAYILQFTDELQCWDRASFGRSSRTEIHPMDCKFRFTENGIDANYIFDMSESKKIIDYWTKYDAYLSGGKQGNEPKVKKYSAMTHENPFSQEIGRIVELSNYGKKEGEIALHVTQSVAKADNRKKNIHLSESNFIHIYDFAVALNAQYKENYVPSDKMMDDFDNLSLEYKLSNIRQAKDFAIALDTIGCFYTDRPVVYEMVSEFSDEELIKLGEHEHKKWENEKRLMCWLPAGDMGNDILKDKSKNLREQLRMHYDLGIDFDDLSDEEKVKDQTPLNTMLEKLMEFDGIRVYRYR